MEPISRTVLPHGGYAHISKAETCSAACHDWPAGVDLLRPERVAQSLCSSNPPARRWTGLPTDGRF
jgi:hypothetical protein